MLIDMAIVILGSFSSIYIRFEGNVPPHYYGILIQHLPVIVLLRLGVFYGSGLYHRLWRYASITDLISIVSAVTVSTAIITVYLIFINAGLPKSFHVLTWTFSIAFIGSSRLAIRVYYHIRHKAEVEKGSLSKVLIVGAGDAGAMIAREIQSRFHDTKKIIGFIDDSKNKLDQRLLGVKVLGTRDNIKEIVKQNRVNEIIIAMPSVEGSIVREIINNCKETKCEIKTVPGIYEIIDGKISVNQLRTIDVEDLLRRDPVQLDLERISGYLRGKSVLVTGAGGSIGSEICRQVAQMGPASIVLLGKGENSIYEIHRELANKYPQIKLAPVIADVRDKARINGVFAKLQPQVVFHAAAHKHVPLMEAQPIEAVRNNVFGTKTVAEAADRVNSEVFVMISTDKAVNPTSAMGATKRVAELVVQNMSNISTTKFVAVRFGNVLGSRGSVVPLFKKQIANGGPVTVTHPEMRRYFMTIPEATQLVLQAGSMAQGGEVFVLDMGEPVKIVDLANDIIELSGFVPNKDIEIKFTGLRPGEKLFEELLTAEEGTSSTKHEKIFKANLKIVNEEKLQRGLVGLQSASSSDDIYILLEKLVPTYQSMRKKQKDKDVRNIHYKTVNQQDVSLVQRFSEN
ncbi:MAG: nucleoside-diphosphate sugar epimerase/dehydratase [Negativicutes bacterium]|nr:nucleoside-diphosphate sugar epimerase/dehydratase [Negativicutes bacterium]